MKTDIKLYIGGSKVDISDNITLNFNYTLEDFEEPTAIINSFTKSIKLEGTDNNNLIFGNIYHLDRNQLYNYNYTGIYFNPSIRTPFELYNGNELIESGYMQLKDITVNDKKITYSITLYGGLGDFFYGLSYNNDGEKLTLADLIYDVEDNQGNVIKPENEFDFNITKDFIYKCFYSLIREGNEIQNFITFIPSYNGIYENFNNDEVLINTNNSEIFTETAITANNKTYTTYNGYALGKLSKKYTEWDLRELRSYMQRPAIKFSKLMETICKPKNNGGYTVELDDDFFNEDNPYYNKTYIALPLFNSQNDGIAEENSKEYNLTPQQNNLTIGKIDNTTIIDSAITNILDRGSTSTIIDLSDLPFASLININLPVSIYYNVINEPSIWIFRNKLNLATTFSRWKDFATPVYRRVFLTLRAKITATDAVTGEKLANDIYCGFGGFTQGQADPNSTYRGTFTKMNDGRFIFEDESGNDTFYVSLNNLRYASKVKITFEIEQISNDKEFNETGLLFSESGQDSEKDKINKYCAKGNDVFNIITDNSKLTINWQAGGVLSNFKITKEKILKTENSPADYLIDYCKLFGLYFVKDIHNKKINILTRNNFFKSQIKNIDDKIDRSKDIKITPLLFEKKFYRMALDTPDSFYSKKYYNEYQLDYGQKRINTNYTFNADVKDLYKDNLYQNTVTVVDKSPYYRTFFNKTGKEIPAFLLDDIEYTLFYHPNEDDESTTEKTYYGSNIVNLKKSINWNTRGGFDVFPKLCCYTIDGEGKSLSDLQSSLVFFDKYELLRDITGNYINYNITDDVKEMVIINDKPCALYTNGEYSTYGERIAISINYLPIFSKYIINNGRITDSLDFGKPKQMYIYDTEYDENTTLYNRFWDNFYKDQFDINCRKVSAYVNLTDLIDVNGELLRQFYAFDNSIWLLNKISNYNPNSNDTTLCEFIKVIDTNHYTNGQFLM